jgi:hypothetical protein
MLTEYALISRRKITKDYMLFFKIIDTLHDINVNHII